MDVIIITSDPEVIDTEKILEAIEALGYFVGGVVVQRRGI